MKDKIILDIETKNAFSDVGGQQNVGKLEASLVCIYSYNKDKYFSFWEKDFPQLGEFLQNAYMIVGFSINRFDLPVLAKYFSFNVKALPRIDILEEIELTYGSRISLDLLAQTNLTGIKKTHHGLDAIRFWEEGNLKELEDYCLQDVKVTKEVYEFIKKNNYVMIPKKFTNELVKVNLNLKEISIPATLF